MFNNNYDNSLTTDIHLAAWENVLRVTHVAVNRIETYVRAFCSFVFSSDQSDKDYWYVGRACMGRQRPVSRSGRAGQSRRAGCVFYLVIFIYCFLNFLTFVNKIFVGHTVLNISIPFVVFVYGPTCPV